MEWDFELIMDYVLLGGIILSFLAIIIYLMTHNPNYSWKEILKNPLRFFALIRHAKEILDESIQEVREETQQTLDDIKEIKEQVQEGVEMVQDAIEEVQEIVKQKDDEKVEM